MAKLNRPATWMEIGQIEDELRTPKVAVWAKAKAPIMGSMKEMMSRLRLSFFDRHWMHQEAKVSRWLWPDTLLGPAWPPWP